MKKFNPANILLFVSMALFVSCVDKNKQVEYVFKKFIEKEQPSIDKLLADKELANWNAHAYGSDSAYYELKAAMDELYERTGSGSSEEAFEHYEGLFYDYIQNDRKFQFLKKIKESGMIKDPQLSQQLNFYYYLFMEGSIYKEAREVHDMSGEMMEAYKGLVKQCKSANPKVDSLVAALNIKDDYRKGWARCHVGGVELAHNIVKRAKLENKMAQKLGYRNYHQYYIESQQVDYDWLVEFYDSLEVATRAPFAKYMSEQKGIMAKRMGMKVEDLRPWHKTMPSKEKVFFGKTIPEKIEELGILNIMKSYFGHIGLPIDGIIANSDFEEREGKYPNALMFRISKNDVRVLGHKNDTYWGMRESLHMFGHAVYEVSVDEKLPFSITSPHMALHEAVAMFFEHLSYNPDWIEANLGIPRDTTLKYMDANYKQEVELQLSRVILMVFKFEKGLYENPDQDLNALWKKLYAEIRMVSYPDDYDLPDWAYIPHIVNEGCSFYAYQLGLVFMWQITNRMHEELPGLDPSYSNDVRIGEFLKNNLFVYGNSYPLETIIKLASGKELSYRAYIEMMSGGQ